MYKPTMLPVVLVVVLLSGTEANTSLGECPDIQPVADFNTTDFLGHWYVIQRTHTATACISYDIAEDEKEPNKFKITEIIQHPTLWTEYAHYETNRTINLKVPNTSQPAVLELVSRLSLTSTKVTVFMTDYENYAAVFTCKKFAVLVHDWTAEILSRKPVLDMKYVDMVRTRLNSHNIDPFTMSIIEQKSCPEVGTEGSIWKITSNVANKIGKTLTDLAKDPNPENKRQ